MKAPVFVGVLTSIFAFAPLVFSSGDLGQIMRPVPMVVIAVLVVSLIEAFLILPTHLSYPKKWSAGILARIRDKVSDGLFRFIDDRFLPFLRLLLMRKYLALALEGRLGAFPNSCPETSFLGVSSGVGSL